MMPKPSYEAINYSIRPAKCIERKMLVESFRQLWPFCPVRSYAYVGFGSTFFTDFALVHRLLGITDLLSIERDIHNSARFDFNCPYKCIRIVYKESTKALPVDVKWAKKTIMWLDYDGRLNDSVLADVSFFCDLAVSGSVLVTTVQSNPDRDSRISRLKNRVGASRVPSDITDDSLEEWGTAGAFYRIITNEIKSALARRNAAKAAPNKIEFRQLFHFTYADGAKMLTVGGIVHEAKDSALVDQCDFSGKLDFVRVGGDPYHLVAPSLTLREIQQLDKQLPCTGTADIKSHGIPTEDLDHYRRVYRYFPRFTESELT